MNICTVTTARRIPFAAVLAESFLEHHPDGSCAVLVSDAGGEEFRERGSRVRVLRPHDIGLSQADVTRLAMTWPEKLLMRALVPELLRFLIQESFQVVLYLADDTSIYASLETLEPSQDEPQLVLALRSSAPLPSDGCTPGQADLLESGVHEAGFAAFGPSSKDCIELWRELVQSDSKRDPSRGLIERAQDLLAAYFPHRLLGEPGAAVSFWNVWERSISQSEAGLRIDGSQLRFFHFEGFDPREAHLLSPAQGPRPRVLLSQRPDLRLLTQDYCERLLAAGFEEAAGRPYRFELLPGGVKVDERMRRLYAQQLRASLAGEGPPPPDPFHPEESDRFIAWLNSPDEEGPAPAVSRYLYALYRERGDLRAAFPGIARADAGKYLDWVIDYGMREAGLPKELCPARTVAPERERTPEEQPAAGDNGSRTSGIEPAEIGQDQAGAEAPVSAEPRLPFGVNVVGYFKAELGVGEMGRLVLGGLEQTGIPYATSAYSAFLSRQTHPYAPVGKEFSFDINLFCVNADQLPSVIRDYGASILEKRYNIGIWWWEVDVLPPQMAASASLLDEIWVGSEYVGRAVVQATDKLVRLLPIPIRKINEDPIDRTAFGLNDGFMFMFSFDFLSIFERKNPLGVVDAYKMAFQAGEGPLLLLKTINGQDHLQELEKLRMAAVDRPDIEIMDRVLSDEDKDRLLALCDCYVSLHRAEGYGLGMAEAMALGKPIIATGYSGNRTFLNESNSLLVDYELVAVPPGCGPYPETATWADPDLDQAAELMRLVFYDPAKARSLGQKAQQDALNLHSLDRTKHFLEERLSSIRLARAVPPNPAG